MVKITSPDHSPKPQSNGGFFLTMSAILALLTRRVNRLTGKIKPSATPKSIKDSDRRVDLKSPAKSKPKKLLSNISKVQFRKKKEREGRDKEFEGWGNGGVWQKEILMGGKCVPLDFSGVICYDINGKRTSEVDLRSPRARSLPRNLTRG